MEYAMCRHELDVRARLAPQHRDTARFCLNSNPDHCIAWQLLLSLAYSTHDFKFFHLRMKILDQGDFSGKQLPVIFIFLIFAIRVAWSLNFASA